jgi:mannitol-1-/sugar-/sorbitol-6-phosphatase
VLFDVDGVLLDGVDTYVAGWREWADGHGIDEQVVVGAMHGRRPEETIREFAPHLDIQTELEALASLLAQAPPLPAMPGARDLLHSLPIGRWAIVTSSRRWHVQRCFEAAGLPIPAVAVYADDVNEGKPAPEGYQRAAHLLGVNSNKALVVEDSPAGVRSGKAAGCLVVGLTTTHTHDALAGADWVLPDLLAATPTIRAFMAQQG